MAEAEKYYTDQQIDEWIESLKTPEDLPEFEEDPKFTEEEMRYTPSCTGRDYSPSNPWDAPGMSVRDFI